MFRHITPRYTYPQPRKFLKFTHRAWYRSSQAATSPHWDSGIYRWSLIEVTKARQISEKLPTWQGPFSGTQGVIGMHNSVLSSSNWVFNEKTYLKKKLFFFRWRFFCRKIVIFFGHEPSPKSLPKARNLVKIMKNLTFWGQNQEKIWKKSVSKKNRNLWVFLILENPTAASYHIGTRVCPAPTWKNSL